MEFYSLYLHIPFCRHRCAYCDFNTYAGLETLVPAYVEALCKEIVFSARAAKTALDVHTIFFGGGTPSLMPVAAVKQILANIEKNYHLTPGVESTLEANPGTVSLGYLQELRGSGVNRLSLGMQSANPDELRLLEREHDFPDVIQAVKWARQAGFDNLSLDLIFGLPYQKMETWQRSLQAAVQLSPEHLSLYALTLEHGTPMQHWTARGLLSEPDPDLAAEMYEWADEYLHEVGYEQYEISNWARQNSEGDHLVCRHNLQYWRCLPYLGFGAGAHGYANNLRVANVLAPAQYIERMRPAESDPLADLPFPLTPVTSQQVVVDSKSEMGEVMMMGLRLTQEGVQGNAFAERFGDTLESFYGEPIARLIKQGLLEWAGDGDERLRLTPRGRLLGNRVFVEFI